MDLSTPSKAMSRRKPKMVALPMSMATFSIVRCSLLHKFVQIRDYHVKIWAKSVFSNSESLWAKLKIRRLRAGLDSGIKISAVEYVNVRGSSSTPVTVSFDRSNLNLCTGIALRDVSLAYQSALQVATSSCRNPQGTASGVVVPPSCL
ncbi:hypothetical protein GUJ93_ZPchr0001g31762 [Zizania palustris]|uniref:Uncharacterized protein n=1 Tax=Zizania palustris TaxID=103762 RepID=A0A8J5VNU3_ZIZPA|nr:hypothetical protein GUJ93_ZPchr0001g31762 [Zizania palustris]